MELGTIRLAIETPGEDPIRLEMPFLPPLPPRDELPVLVGRLVADALALYQTMATPATPEEVA